MKKNWIPLVSLLGAGIMLAGCGAGNQPTNGSAPGLNSQASYRTEATSPDEARRSVVIHFRDRDQLAQLAKAGVDLFENVDHETKTVGATLTARTEPVLKQLGVTSVDTKISALEAFPAGYQTVERVYADMKAMAAAHPEFIELVTFGKSLETTQGKANRPMMALRFTSKRNQGLPSIRLGSGIHARELPPVELMSRFAHTLADGYGKDKTITKLVDTKEIWIVPLQNPDGREKVQQGSSLWRKNTRQDNQSPQGVDVNRNADSHFTQGDSNAWADDYRGSAPFSEPESQALRDLSAKHHFDIALDMHCFGGMVLWPPGYSNDNSADEATFSRIGNTLGQQLGYKSGTIARTIYPTYGDMATWDYETNKTLSFAAELDCDSFNPAYSEVDRQWAKWKDTLLYLVSQTGSKRTL